MRQQCRLLPLLTGQLLLQCRLLLLPLLPLLLQMTRVCLSWAGKGAA
jgi:hypothetical protein